MAAVRTSEALRGPQAAHELVLAVLREHAESLLAVARRHSLCADDAQDAYQRGVEIFLRHAARLDAQDAHRWVHTVVKHEAMRLRGQRSRLVAGEDVDLDGHEAARLPTADEQVASFDLMARSAEALQRLKPQELRALWLKAQGHSYAEIAELEGWTHTKVNRCITEGRRAFLGRMADIASGAECRRWEPVLSAMVDGEASARELAGVRPHLRHCPACRGHVRELHEASAGLAALLPVPVGSVGAADGGGLLARVYEAAAGLQDRVVVSAAKAQAGLEASLSAKVAVAAASAAMIGGGGVALERSIAEPHTKPTRAAKASALRAAARPPAPPVALARPAPDVPAPAAKDASATGSAAATSRRTVARRTTRTEFGLSGSGARAASAQTAAEEFEQPAPSTSPQATTASSSPEATAPAPAPAAAPAPAPSRDARTAAAEFGG